MNYKEITSLKTANDVDKFIVKYFSDSVLKKCVELKDIKDNWKYVGDEPSNASTIDMLDSGEKGIIERITNGIDAIIEKQKDSLKINGAKKITDIIAKAYPKYFENIQNVIKANGTPNTIKDASSQIIVAVNDGSKKNTPTFDVLDYGTGISGELFSKTILSLHGGNKINEEQSYLIGTFGQGGSTSLSFAYATIIISKVNDEIYFTIIKKIQIKGMKNHVYVYLTENGKIINIENCVNSDDEYISDWAKGASGTFVRMIDLEIDKRYRENDITKPRMLGDYFNIELFDIKFPIQMLERRKYFLETSGHQDRYSYGSRLKLLASKKHYKKQYSGTTEIIHNNNPYKISFYIILPTNKDDWANDVKCKETYEMYNLHGKPMFFTVNGQYINGENYTKLNNRGLSFLKYRLLVHINLDVLGNEKYQFFTTDRSRIKNTDLTEGFLDKVIKEISVNCNKKLSTF